MEKVTLRSGCKINLNLTITGTRADGYHTLESIFLPLQEPHDYLHIQPLSQGQGCQIISTETTIHPQNNTLYTAWALFAEYTGFAPDIHVKLEKNIPLGAGLGGGSSNAAILLKYLNRLLAKKQKPIPQQKLHSLALKIGADVPFFLYNRPAFVSGIGEQITPVQFLAHSMQLLLVCPDVHVNTAHAYAAWDAFTQEKTTGKKERLTSKAPHAKKLSVHVCRIENDLEKSVFTTYPKLRYLKEEILAGGASAAAMSGSGASLFGLFTTHTQMQQLAHKMHKSGIRTYCQAL